MKNLTRFIHRNPLLKTLFVTKDNKIVIGQLPNVPVLGAGALLVASQFVPPELQPWTEGGYTSLLIVWSVEEITSGVNLFRKLMGCGVLILQAKSVLRFIANQTE